MLLARIEFGMSDAIPVSFLGAFPPNARRPPKVQGFASRTTINACGELQLSPDRGR